MVKQKRSKKNGRFLAVYDWDKVITEICRQYTEGKSWKAILRQPGMPDWAGFYNKYKSNPDYEKQVDASRYGKADLIDNDYDDIARLAKKAVKGGNANALRPWLDARVKQRGQLNAKYRDREVKHVHEVGPSMRQLMTEARQRRDAELLESPIEGEFSET